MMIERPLLSLNVDGTLLPFAADGRRPGDDANPLLARLDPGHGRRLVEVNELYGVLLGFASVAT